MTRRRTLVVCLGLVGLGLAAMLPSQMLYAQETFEVASIKPHPGMVTFSADPSVKGNRVTGTASTLFDLIEVAYRVRRDQIAGAPGWADSEHYDLEAKAGARAITTEQMRPMLRALLAERLQLQVHRETKEAPMFALVVDKGGVKLKESAADEKPKGLIRGDGTGMHMEVAVGTMAQLASRLSSNGAGREVTDRTGLTGNYTYQLEWVNGTSDSELPPLAIALREQLGLRLELMQGTKEMIVIDHVERPSAN